MSFDPEQHRFLLRTDANVAAVPDSSHKYDNIDVSGQATAIFGNNYGKIINVFNDSFTKSLSLSPFSADAALEWTVRQNRVSQDHTLEIISKYQIGGPTNNNGLVSQVQHRWYRGDIIGGGLYAEVYREERTDTDGTSVRRAVKVMRRTFLRKLGVDYRKELNALIQLSQVRSAIYMNISVDQS